MYEQIKNVKVHEFGCLPHPNYDYLAASPDGITDDGVMLEIKCPYSRQITGIPPIYYWYQMQLQLEVCNLNECDYLECNIKEYNNEEEFLRDNTVEYKGVLIKVNDKYEYYKGDICNYKQWLDIGWTLHNIENSDRMLDLWIEFSKTRFSVSDLPSNNLASLYM